MEIVKTANKTTKITLSKKEWTNIGKKAGWMKSAAMDLPQNVEWYDDQFPKIPKLDNYFLIKEHQKWGYCPTYRNKDNKDDVLYYYEGKLWRWEELKEELKDTWRPASREEQDWFVTHLASSKKTASKRLVAQEFVDEDQSEPSEDDLIKRRRTIRVEFSDGDHLVTDINGTKQQILDYYFKQNEPQDYDLSDLSKKRTVTDVKFLK